MDFVLTLILGSSLLLSPVSPALAPDATPTVAAVDTGRVVVQPAVPDTAAARSLAADTGLATPASVDAAASMPLGPVQPAPWPRLEPATFTTAPDGAGAEPQRPRAVEMSEAYHIRLTIHYIASFATIPLFVTEYILGNRLYTNPVVSRTTRDEHRTVATGVAALFAVNTVTGAWNLWDSRKDSNGALRRYLHSGLMFLADAGFVATGLVAPHHSRYSLAPAGNRTLHRTLALSSMGTALASYAMMLIWRN